MPCACDRIRPSPHASCAEAMQVSLSDIAVASVRLGIYPQERVTPQRIVVGLTLSLDLRGVLQRDHIDETVNYAELVADVHELAQARHYDLLESLTARLTLALLERHPRLVGVAVEVHKVEAPVAATVRARWRMCRGAQGA